MTDPSDLRCIGCGELLDRDSTVCRVCGEDNSNAALEGTPRYEIAADFPVDRIQPWSQIKHEIIEKYLGAYNRILNAQPWLRRSVYIDAFAGAGVAFDAETDDLVAAGALRAIEVEPRFSEYHFIEADRAKAEILERITVGRRDVHVHPGDFRQHLPGLLARCRYEDFARGVCLLDPYGLTVDYELLKQIALMGTVEIFFNFMLVSANRNVLWRRPEEVTPKRRELLTRVWGADWFDTLYKRQPTLFGEEFEKVTNQQVVAAYQDRLKQARFAYVPNPIPMLNRSNAALYYLFFCGQNATGANIVVDIFERYR